MVLIPVGDGSYKGLSGDRPSAAIASGVRFTDNTGEESYWDGSKWVQAPRSVSSGSNITGIISGSPTFFGTVTVSGNISLRGITWTSGVPQVSGIYPTSGLATGSIPVASGGVMFALPMGSGGQYFKVNSTATAVGWEDDSISLYTDDLVDVVNTSPGRGQLLRYDGSNYVNKDNTFFQEKIGKWLAVAASGVSVSGADNVGEGLLMSGLVATATTIADQDDAANGHGRRFGSSGVTTAFGLKQTISYYQRRWNARIISKVAFPSSSSNCRAYAGFLTQSGDLLNSNDYLSGVGGIIVGIRHDTVDTNLQVFYNSGGVAGVADTGILRSNNVVYTIEIACSSGDAKVYIGVDNTLPVLTNTISSGLPPATTSLFPHIGSIRTGGGAKNLDIWKVTVGTV